MRRVLSLLICFAVLLCGLHMLEPLDAAATVADHGRCLTDTAAPGCEDTDAPPVDAHGCHHHSPVAPIERVASLDMRPNPAGAPVFRLPISALHSRSQAPPLEPPTA